MCFIDDGFQFFHRQRRLRHQLALLVHPRTVRHVHLDPVRAVLKLLPRCFSGFHRAVHDLRPLGHLQFRRVAFQVVAAGRGNRARRAKKSRARNCPFFNRLLDLYVSVSRAFGFHVPQSCESLLERTARRKRGAARPQRNPGLENILVVAAFRRILAPQENMCVRINEPRQDRRIRKINYFRA